jgi:rubrerythrin
MEELERLKTLLHHWAEHNEEHAAIYKDWASKATELNQKEASEILGLIYQQTNNMTDLFNKALKSLSGK